MIVAYACYQARLIYLVIHSSNIYWIPTLCLHTPRLLKNKDEWERYGPCSHRSYSLLKIMLEDYRQIIKWEIEVCVLGHLIQKKRKTDKWRKVNIIKKCKTWPVKQRMDEWEFLTPKNQYVRTLLLQCFFAQECLLPSAAQANTPLFVKDQYKCYLLWRLLWLWPEIRVFCLFVCLIGVSLLIQCDNNWFRWTFRTALAIKLSLNYYGYHLLLVLSALIILSNEL